MKLSDIELWHKIVSELGKVPKEDWDKAIEEVDKEEVGVNMEEKSIKNLKEYMERDPYFNGTCKVESDFDKFCYEHCKDIDNLIKGYEILKDENINLNDELQMTRNSIKIANLDVMEDYIPKSKLREIVEDIDNNQPVIAELKLRKLLQEGDK